ncbi:MAG: hypothetical protein SGARI_005156 [Bacillariaceae sp.]
MHYLDKGVILGVDRSEICGLFSYVEHFASQMAHGPIPLAIQCNVLDYLSEQNEDTLISSGLSKPIEFPVEEVTPHLINTAEITTRGTPFVIRGMASEWPATKEWRDMGALAKEHGHRMIPIEIGNMASGMTELIVSFRQFVGKYLSDSAKKDCWSLQDATSDSGSSPSIAYLAQHPLLNQIPALYSDVKRKPLGVNPTNVNIWMGTGGTRTPLHFDSYDNFLVQIVGAKYVRLYAREYSPKLYVSTNKSYGLQGNMSDLDCEMEDFEKHPMAKDCPYQEVLLLPGDCLFIPSQHWHYVRSLSTSISVNYWF